MDHGQSEQEASSVVLWALPDAHEPKADAARGLVIWGGQELQHLRIHGHNHCLCNAWPAASMHDEVSVQSGKHSSAQHGKLKPAFAAAQRTQNSTF